ncbi:MAG: hypothetical protein J6E38_03095 [Clostridia bacterium]|nr:hypothetical protein [Clostridia bacterium]
MKRKILTPVLITVGVLACLYLLIMFFRFLENPALASLPRYKSEKGYISDGFQDYTIYREYHYSNSKKMNKGLEKSLFFQKVEEDDVDVINGYLENFKDWLKHTNFENECKFDSECIDTSDYWYLINKWENDGDDHRYYDYDLYYYDAETMTMYMIHNNI